MDIEIAGFVPPGNPGGEVERLTGVLHPPSSTRTIATATRCHIEPFGLSFSQVGKDGHGAPFALAA